MAGRKDRRIARPTAPPAVYACYAAALAASALSLAPGYAGIVLLIVAAVAASLWLAGLLGIRPGRLDSALGHRFESLDRLVLLRLLVAGCLAVTIVITWPLWGPRTYPPLLPAAAVPQIHFGPLLLASLLLVVAVPRTGIWVHLAVLVPALVADQTRLQPEFVSLSALLVAANVPGWGLTVGRAHLVTMWIWAGLHKMLSLGFMTGAAQWIYAGLPFEIVPLRDRFGWVIAGTELATGILLLVPALRRLGVVLALGLHGMILIVLSPWNQDWNHSVWPWNFALGWAALLLFWPSSERRAEPAPSRPQRTVRVAIASLAALYPLGFYLGMSDAYLSHHLYSDAVAVAYCEPVTCRSADFGDTWTAFDVPLPPEPRLYRDYFFSQCEAGEELVLLPRRTKVLMGLNSKEARVQCPASSS